MKAAALLVVHLVTAMLSAGAAHADTEPVRAIEIAGNHRIAPESVELALGIHRGDRCDAASLNAAVKRAFATGQFADVRIACDAGIARIAVVENPIVGRIVFENRSAIEEKDLAQAAGLAVKDVFTRTRGEAAARHIADLYRNRGYADATVSVRTSTAPDGRMDVVFALQEASVVKIERIAFTGNRVFTEAQLRDVVSTRQAGWFDFLKPVTAPVEDRLDYDRELLLRHYRNHGFYDVEIAPAVRTRQPGSDGRLGHWQVAFAIDEGERYTIARVGLDASRLKTPLLAPEDRVLRAASLRTGGHYEAISIETAIEKTTRVLLDAGHPSAEVSARISRDRKSLSIGVTLEIAEGPRLLIERIEIAGNRLTRDHVIRRELEIAEGDIYHPFRAKEAKRRLMRLGLFKSVDIAQKPSPSGDRNRIVLVVRVTEADTAELGFGIGYSDTQGIVGDVTYAERNLLGRGQELRLKLAASEMGYEGRLGFTEPRFLGTRIAAGFDLFYKDTDYTNTSSYKSTRYGATLRAGTEIAPSTTSTFGYTLSRNTIYDVGAGASQLIKLAIPGFPNATSAAYDTSAVSHTVAYDTRDNKRIPMNGVLIASSQELAGLGGDARYLRTTAEARTYLPIATGINLAARASGGTIGGWGGSEVRLLDNFFRGGEMVRGFAPSGIGPRDVLSTAQDALGGTTYAAASAELRFALPYLTDQAGVRATVFADTGTLFGTSATAKSLPGVVGTSASLRASVGAGLLWDSPVGPLQAGYAIPVAKQTFDKTQNLYFGLGSGL